MTDHDRAEADALVAAIDRAAPDMADLTGRLRDLALLAADVSRALQAPRLSAAERDRLHIRALALVHAPGTPVLRRVAAASRLRPRAALAAAGGAAAVGLAAALGVVALRRAHATA